MKNFAASNLVVTAIMVLAATAAAGQSPEPPPDWLEPDLPPGVDRLCARPIVPDLPPGVVRASSTASDELPPLPPWCDGTCVIDIAFFYDPKAIGLTYPDSDTPLGPQSVSELLRDIDHAITGANVVLRRAGLDAKLRVVGIEREPRLSGLDLSPAILGLFDWGHLAHARRRYGADLVYAVTGAKTKSCGMAIARVSGLSADSAKTSAVGGAIHVGCLGLTLAHEVGHNLGLDHHIGASSFTPFVPFGRGYVGPHALGQFGTIMSIDRLGVRSRLPAFSSPEPLDSRVRGNAEVDAVRALRYTIPDAARYSATVVPEAKEDPHGYGCRPSSDQACLSERRFRVRANYSTPTVSRGPATRLETFGLGDSSSIFYFFDAGNPELLVKVVNGCWLNDHWWVFGSAATDLRYEVSVADLASGDAPLSYAHGGRGVIAGTNGYSTGAGVIADTMALPCGGSSAAAPAPSAAVADPASVPGLEGDVNDQGSRSGLKRISRFDREPRQAIEPGGSVPATAAAAATATDYGCTPNRYVSCLNTWRFQVSARLGDVGLVHARPQEIDGLGNSASLFYFFDYTNPELLVKVVDGCAINGHWWVFGSAATDLEYQVAIADVATVGSDGYAERLNYYYHKGGGRITGSRRTWERSRRTYERRSEYSARAGVIADTTAFPCSRTASKNVRPGQEADGDLRRRGLGQ